ncbi:MAG: hypothetical protein JKY62_00440 [Desulfocapsa sp.]|nr:hypothetical protein [Desulfocapsa sp.]MBN4048792.1 hypothetical protein [bacterium AH-315-N22]MBN4058796.1 hypothetical protein [Desulfocapsa sp. AH-315-J15]
MFLISSKQNGFRRAGVVHPAEETGYPDDYFNDEQIEAIVEEPMLSISHVVAPDQKIPADPFAELTALDKAFGCAIDCLDEDKKNKDDWTRSGAPQVKVLASIMGEDVSAGMRDVAYKMHQEGAE